MPPTDEELQSAAILEELRSGRNLMDGVIPDLPEQQTGGTRFAFASCQYPGGFLDRTVAYDSYLELARRLEVGDNAPRFVVLTGDQVYTDATAGILDPSIADGRYVLPYNRWLRARAVRTVLRQVHTFMLLDDHEVENDWEEEPPAGSDRAEVFDTAMAAYRKYQSDHISPAIPPYFDFRFDQFRFFMLDTRTRREPRDLDNIATADIFDGQGPGSQYGALDAWLNGAHPNRPNFIMSPSMLLPRHREAARWGDVRSAIHSDGWDGYLASLHRLLARVYESNADHIVFLSGDEHFGCIATITIREILESGPSEEKTFYSIHSPGLFTPYAFANSGDIDWMAEDSTEFSHGGKDYEYTVHFISHQGEGFAYIDVADSDTGWHLTCQFGDGTVHPVF